jgi:hypothetical protein
MKSNLFLKASAPLATLASGFVGAALALSAGLATAAPAHNVCVPQAQGVPTMSGPPKWLAAWGGGAPVSAALDDPRWLGAVGASFELGSAKAPLHSRAVWANEGGQDFLYLSFIVDVEGLLGAGATSPRDLFVGFRRPAAVAGEAAYIFQFHLNSAAGAGLIAPTHCARFSDCAESAATPQNYWRVFVDRGNTASCGSTGLTGSKFDRLVGATVSDPPVTWMTDAVRYWKLGTTEPPLLQNRWAVQVRFPIAAAGQPLSAGIERDSLFWYQATAQVSGAGGGDYVNLGWWPRELTSSICPNTAIADFLVHPEVATADKLSRLTLFSGARPADCDGGIRIRSQNIGALFEAPAATDFSIAAVSAEFKALKPDGTAGTNTVIAQPENTSGAPITAPLLARFRLAGWGSAPWSSSDPGRWKDMRGAENGVCSAGSSPSCTATTIAAGGKGAITFKWQMGNDAQLGPSEYCQFSLTPPAGGGSCVACTCTAADQCDAPSGAGVRSNGAKPGGGSWACVSPRYGHQCMMVELSAPNGGVTFESQSSWNNMSFGQMSVLEREALIDVRGLPVAAGQKEQEIYLIAMPRNMPAAIAGGTTTGNQVVAQRAFEAAQRIVDEYRESYDRLPAEERLILARRLKHPVPSLDELKRDRRTRVFGERYVITQQVRTVLPQEDYERAGKLLDLAGRAVDEQVSAERITRDIVEIVGPTAAAEIVPTLEIYSFYKPVSASGNGPSVFMPMTSFSIFLSHQGALNGITWELDGATRVGENIYRLTVPVERARRIRVRSQAIEPGELVLRPGEPGWPCGGGCACGGNRCGVVAGLNNTVPTLLAGFFFARKRRRKPAKETKVAKPAP